MLTESVKKKIKEFYISVKSVDAIDDCGKCLCVIYDSQIEGGLNFNKDYRIDRNCKVINGVLYWSDNYNEPKKINIDKGIKTNQAGYSTNETAYEIPSGGIPYTTFTTLEQLPKSLPLLTTMSARPRTLLP